MYTLYYSTVTHCAQQAQQAFAALQQQATAAYTVSCVLQQNNYYVVRVERMFNCYNSAVNTFNNTVAQYCNTVAQYIDVEDYSPSCYVLDVDNNAVY
jgi:chlorite dismutase